MRSKKLILTKTKYELAVVCPGEITNMPGNNDKIYAREPRLILALNVFTNQIKGSLLGLKNQPDVSAGNKINIHSEIKRLMQIMTIIADTYEQSAAESHCFRASLQMLDCRKGCPNCALNGLFMDIEGCFQRMHYDESKSNLKMHHCYCIN